jgi:P pilus assembly chaperone PapD
VNAAVVRRVVAALLAVAAVAAPTLVDRDRTAPGRGPGDVGGLVAPVMPVLRPAARLGATWFCPGVSAGADGLAGVIVLANPADDPTRVTVTVTPSEGAPVVKPLDVGARARVEIEVTEFVTARFAAAQVETTSGSLVVEQRSTARLDADNVVAATSPCATAPSQAWYLADGATTTDAEDTLLVYNPFPDDAVISMVFADDSGLRRPPSFQRQPVAPRSLKVITIDSVVQRKEQVSVTITADAGRVVVGRHQVYTTKPRRTLVAGLATPSAGTQWSFADAEVRGGEEVGSAATSFAVYNPGSSAAEVSVVLLPAAGSPAAPAPAPDALAPTEATGSPDGATTTVDPTDPAAAVDPAAGAGRGPLGITIAQTVPAGGTAVVAATAAAGVPDGFYSALVVSTAPVVVERLLRRTGDPRVVTTVQLGSRLLSRTWQFASSPPVGWGATLVVANPSPVAARVTVKTLGPGGLVALAELTDVEVPPGGSTRWDVSALGAGASPLTVTSDTEVVVERLLAPPADRPGSSITYGIPSGP